VNHLQCHREQRSNLWEHEQKLKDISEFLWQMGIENMEQIPIHIYLIHIEANYDRVLPTDIDSYIERILRLPSADRLHFEQTFVIFSFIRNTILLQFSEKSSIHAAL